MGWFTTSDRLLLCFRVQTDSLFVFGVAYLFISGETNWCTWLPRALLPGCSLAWFDRLTVWCTGEYPPAPPVVKHGNGTSPFKWMKVLKCLSENIIHICFCWSRCYLLEGSSRHVSMCMYGGMNERNALTMNPAPKNSFSGAFKADCLVFIQLLGCLLSGFFLGLANLQSHVIVFQTTRTISW